MSSSSAPDERPRLSWDLNELREEVMRAHGKDARFKISPCLNSIHERQAFANYHYHEARESITKYLDVNYSDEGLFRMTLTGEGDDAEDFAESRFKSRAHVLACIQNMHAVSDILAHVIYYALGLTSARKESSIDLRNVTAWLEQIVKYSTLLGLLNRLQIHDDYEYLSDLSNHSKHRSVVSSQFNFNFLKGINHMKELVFPSFSHKGREHPKRLALEFLSTEYDRQAQLVVEIGREINALVKTLP